MVSKKLMGEKILWTAAGLFQLECRIRNDTNDWKEKVIKPGISQQCLPSILGLNSIWDTFLRGFIVTINGFEFPNQLSKGPLNTANTCGSSTLQHGMWNFGSSKTNQKQCCTNRFRNP